MKIPGFVDLQVNGYMGISFSSPELTEKTFLKACKELFARGTAAFLPTVVTSPKGLYKKNLPLIARAMIRPELQGKVLGIHVEGPFVSREPGAVGAHNPEWAMDPDMDFFDQMMDWAEGQIKILTLAAELPGAERLIGHAVRQGVTVSVGHQMAMEDDLARATDAGATLYTHLGNAQPNMLPRHPNPIWAGIAEERLTAMIISDGHHLPASLIKTIVRARSAHGVIVTSDASPIAGLLPGRYEVLHNVAVLEENGRLHNPEKGCLVGSSACMLDCMNYLSLLGILSEEELRRVGFYNPLKAIGVGVDGIKPCGKVVFGPERKRVGFEFS